MYSVSYTTQAAKQLKKLDKQTAKLIYAWIEKNLEGCENPRRLGKALVVDHSNQWRYRIGDYRLLADISDEKITILILSIGHRRDVYKQ